MWKFVPKLLTYTEKLVSHAVDSKASGSSLGLDLACGRLNAGSLMQIQLDVHSTRHLGSAVSPLQSPATAKIFLTSMPSLPYTRTQEVARKAPF